MPSDLEIAREATLEDIAAVAWKLALPADGLHSHGKHIAKVTWPCIQEHLDRPQGSLILVTSVNPTPFGEGKTVTTIGLTQALNRIGRSATCVVRVSSNESRSVAGSAENEPSVFL